VIAIGALLLPPTVYLMLKNCIIKPHNLWRRRQKSNELRRIMYQQVHDARAASENLQLLLKNVADRKKQKQVQSQGLVILAAIYGDIEAYEKGVSGIQYTAQSAGNGIADLPPYLDVTIPLQFLVDDSGQLRLHEGVKKVGLMGFCDPCPGELKQLKVLYSFLGQQYEVKVGDYDQLWLPQERNRI
jgi:DnaJ family protein C protein 11